MLKLTQCARPDDDRPIYVRFADIKTMKTVDGYMGIAAATELYLGASNFQIVRESPEKILETYRQMAAGIVDV